MIVLWRPAPPEHPFSYISLPLSQRPELPWALGELWLSGAWTHGLRQKKAEHSWSVELFIKNVPTVKLDPVLSETMLISLSQDTCLKSWHHTTITLFQDLETWALWITIAWCLLVVRKPVIPQRLCKGKGINMMGEISYSLILRSTEVKVHALAPEALTRSSQIITCLSGLKFVTCGELNFLQMMSYISVEGRAGKGECSRVPVKKTDTTDLSAMFLTPCLRLWKKL